MCCNGLSMSRLEDGTYDVIVVAADEHPGGAMVLELAVSSGVHRGDVVRVSAAGLSHSWDALLAAPGVLTVRAGEPSFALDR